MFHVLWNNVPIIKVSALVTLERRQYFTKGWFLPDMERILLSKMLSGRGIVLFSKSQAEPHLIWVRICFSVAFLRSAALTCTSHRVSGVLSCWSPGRMEPQFYTVAPGAQWHSPHPFNFLPKAGAWGSGWRGCHGASDGWTWLLLLFGN